ncbi:MAG: hypothetical protein BWZ02_00627 [Lentisphaerae bacterium ADurb.BinA184]|nr:MAG: hypothetical protein BWZ02_00627 [Lentisphaerae bacterium ADurb.BinA184]
MTDILASYLSEVAATHATHAHVAETSFYPALANLLNAVGGTLSPKVRCVINLKNRGGGIPDGGLFTADQLRRPGRKASGEPDNPILDQPPARGVIEAKPPSGDVAEIAGSEQVGRYWKTYGLVLVTNFRAFALVGRTAAGQPAMLESFALADSEDAFWRLAAHPQAAAKRLGERFVEYLRRALLHNAPLSRPQDLAGILASYARDARARMEEASDLPALAGLRRALEDALGLRFEGEKGEHFFRSTLVQTLFYGTFAAWATWARRRLATASASAPGFGKSLRDAAAPYGSHERHFDWRKAEWNLRVPMIRALFEQIATPSKLGPLGLVEVLDWTAATLGRVDGAAFFAAFDEGHAIQYFYEPFLQAFDPELRKELGVWYTPEEIVEYQVERVDRVLREELGIPDGLADPSVIVLDACCGTGTYLRAVLHRIAATLRDKGGDALLAHDLKRAAIERVYGFEILPAPFVIAHLQLGLLLDALGAPLSDAKSERVGVYLTNALTGWEPPKDKPKQLILGFPELAEERDAAEHVKQSRPILVILGNPPYNAFAGISPEEENGLVEPYKKGLVAEWGIKKFNLDDLYVRFFRLAEKCIAERGGRGVVSFISNHSWVSDPSFVVMRRRFLDEFDAVWVDGMNGDSRETGKLTPEGNPDPSVFSTDWNREGIRVGTAIALLVKRDRTRGTVAARKDTGQDVRFRQYWGASKRADLLASLNAPDFDAQYERAEPSRDNRWSFRPGNIAAEYTKWVCLSDIPAIPPTLGILDNRQEALISTDREALIDRVRKYLDPSIGWDELERFLPELARDYARFDARAARAKLLAAEPFNMANVRRVLTRPMDVRWCYYTAVRPIWTETRPTYMQQCWPGNTAFVCRRTSSATPEGAPAFFTSAAGMQHALHTDAYYSPLHVRRRFGKDARGATTPDLPGIGVGSEAPTANLSPAARAYLASLGLPDPDADQETAELVWMHALAIGYSPAYIEENADGIRQDWPRIPLPAGKTALAESATLGRQVAALLDTEAPVPGVTASHIRDDLKPVAVFARVAAGVSPKHCLYLGGAEGGRRRRRLQSLRERQPSRAMEGGPPCPPGHTRRPGLPWRNPDDTEVVPPARQTTVRVGADGGPGSVPATHARVLQAALPHCNRLCPCGRTGRGGTAGLLQPTEEEYLRALRVFEPLRLMNRPG